MRKIIYAFLLFPFFVGSSCWGSLPSKSSVNKDSNSKSRLSMYGYFFGNSSDGNNKNNNSQNNKNKQKSSMYGYFFGSSSDNNNNNNKSKNDNENNKDDKQLKTYTHGTDFSPPPYKDLTANQKKNIQDEVFSLCDTCLAPNNFPIVPIFGITGSGKSTLINFLIGSKIYRHKCRVFIDKNRQKKKKYAPIGHKSTPETYGISLYEQEKEKFYFCDTEGFLGDRVCSRSGLVDSLIADYSPYFTLAANGVKGVILTISATQLSECRFSFKENGIDKVYEPISCLVKYFGAKSVLNMKDSFLLIVTQCDNIDPVQGGERVTDTLKMYIMQLYQYFYSSLNKDSDSKKNSVSKCAQIKPFFDILLKNEVKGSDINHLSSYKLDENRVTFSYIFERKGRIKNINNSKYKPSVGVKESSSDYVVDEECRDYILSMIKRLKKVPKENLKDYHYSHIKKAITDRSMEITSLVEKRKILDLDVMVNEGYFGSGSKNKGTIEKKKLIEGYKKKINDILDDKRLEKIDHVEFKQYNPYSDYSISKNTEDAADAASGILNNKYVNNSIKIYSGSIATYNAFLGGVIAGPAGVAFGSAIGAIEFLACKAIQKGGGLALGLVGGGAKFLISSSAYLINGYLVFRYGYKECDFVQKIVCISAPFDESIDKIVCNSLDKNFVQSQSSNGSFIIQSPSRKELKNLFNAKVFNRDKIILDSKKNSFYNKDIAIKFCSHRGKSANAFFGLYGKTGYSNRRIQQLYDLINFASAKGKDDKKLPKEFYNICNVHSLNAIRTFKNVVILKGYTEGEIINDAYSKLFDLLSKKGKLSNYNSYNNNNNYDYDDQKM